VTRPIPWRMMMMMMMMIYKNKKQVSRIQLLYLACDSFFTVFVSAILYPRHHTQAASGSSNFLTFSQQINVNYNYKAFHLTVCTRFVIQTYLLLYKISMLKSLLFHCLTAESLRDVFHYWFRITNTSKSTPEEPVFISGHSRS